MNIWLGQIISKMYPNPFEKYLMSTFPLALAVKEIRFTKIFQNIMYIFYFLYNKNEKKNISVLIVNDDFVFILRIFLFHKIIFVCLFSGEDNKHK